MLTPNEFERLWLDWHKPYTDLQLAACQSMVCSAGLWPAWTKELMETANQLGLIEGLIGYEWRPVIALAFHPRTEYRLRHDWSRESELEEYFKARWPNPPENTDRIYAYFCYASYIDEEAVKRADFCGKDVSDEWVGSKIRGMRTNLPNYLKQLEDDERVEIDRVRRSFHSPIKDQE